MPFRALLPNKKLLILLLALVLLRLPYINRPLSKHHDFVTAVFIINAESWQQAGGGNNFYYTPLLTYQGIGNKLLEKGMHIDAAGNHVYLSFGAGWYLFPYAFFELFSLPFTPVAVQLFSLFVGLLTTIFLFGLLLKMTGNRQQSFAGTIFFSMLPATLWYCGTGFGPTAFMLPFVILLLHQWHAIQKQGGNVRPLNLLKLFFYGLLLCYIDWLAVFLLAAIALWALIKRQENKRYLWVSLVAVLSAILGVLLVLAQFSAYLGWQQVLDYWKARFVDRSANTTEFAFGQMLLMIVRNMATGYLPLIIVLAIAVQQKALKQLKIKLSWPIWALAAIIPYNGLFLNWSAVHEFAWMAFGLIGSIATTVYLFPLLNNILLKKILVATTVASLLMYYIINLPGSVSLKGDRYDQQQLTGNMIRTAADTSSPVFTNLDNDKIVSYYSGRTLNFASTLDRAKVQAAAFGFATGTWVVVANGKVEKIIRFSPPNSR